MTSTAVTPRKLELVKNAALPLATVAVVLSGVAGLAQTSVPDAQVEASVLKALAGASDLADESITTRTVYGTVTLSGSVRNEAARRHAETLASTTEGVRKVVDELTIGGAAQADAPSSVDSDSQQPTGALVLQSDGTYAPAPAGTMDQPAAGSAPSSLAQRNDPDNDQALDRQQESQPGAAPAGSAQAYPQGQNGYAYPPANSQRRPLTAQNGPYGNSNYPPPQSGYPAQGGYPQQQSGYPEQGGYPQQGGYSQQNQPYGNGQRISAAPLYGGQIGGETVVVPAGALLRIRLNRTLSSDRTPAGTIFDGIVTNDVTAGGAIAIPRGASVQGVVVEAKSSGALHGRGELTLQVTGVQLAGRSYALVSDLWAHQGGDKTIQTINRTAGFGAGGALLGALAGGGVGAAVGGGIGAAVGLGASAASNRGEVYLPAEGLLTFHLDQPATLRTVSEQEMQRLAYGVPAGTDAGRYRRGPVYGSGPGYPPYGYPTY